MIIPLKSSGSNIYEKALTQGAQILEDRSAYLYRMSKKKPNKLVQKVISSNGSYSVYYSNYDGHSNPSVEKVIKKTILNDKSYVVDTWNYKNQTGSKIEVFEKEKGANTITRVHDKKAENSLQADGVVYQWVKGLNQKRHEFVKTKCNLSMARNEAPSLPWAKNFNPSERLQYLYAEFYKSFNK